MKTRTKQKPRLFQLRIVSFGITPFLDTVDRLEVALARQPAALQLDIIGTLELNPDFALLVRSVLLARSTKTRLITNARSSLQGSAILIWLLGDTRMIRDEARLYFRPTTLSEEEQAEWKQEWTDKDLDYKDSESETDPDEANYWRVLQLIDEFLPVKELAGRPIGARTLAELGLLENEKLDDYLSNVLSKPPPQTKPSEIGKSEPSTVTEPQLPKTA